MKIRIYALAKELGLDNKELIEYANKAGVRVKSSGLASISPEERDTIVRYIETAKPSGGKAAPEPSKVPARDHARDVTGKVRTIQPKSRPARPAPSRPAPARPLEARSESESTATAVLEAPPETEEETLEEPEMEQFEAAEEEAAAEATEPQPDQQPPQAAAKAVPSEADSETAEDEAARDEGEDEIEPIKREDYIPAAGSGRMSVREMKPRGTVPDGGAARREQKERSRRAPQVAAPPTYKPPKKTRPQKKKDEAPAQKPDIRLTADALEQQSPLRAHMQEQKRRRGTKAGETDLREAARKGKLEEIERQHRKDRRRARRVQQEEAEETRRRMPRRPVRRKKPGPVTFKTEAEIEPPITVRSLSEAMGRPARSLLGVLFDRGEMLTINETIPEDTALELAMELGVDLRIKHGRDIEHELAERLTAESPPEKLIARPPIVTILGHVDHGKTTLLDKIRSADVAAGEAGGITQHIAAYQVEHNGRKITFVDTPGHAAFGEMRARGANVTDIIVLVVAADDGVMPQTVECISHAKAAGVPIVVAMNKMDLPDANEQKVLSDLAGQDVLPTEWGGEVDVIRTSGATGKGIDDLLETLLITAEVHEYKAAPDCPAVGVCLEAFRDEGRGVLAWLIVQKGTLKVGDVVLCGPAHGRIRAMYDDYDREQSEAGPSTPVKVAGLDRVPSAGDHFFVMSDVEEARQVAEDRYERGRSELLALRRRPRTLEDILAEARGGAVQELPLIIKADTPGSLEALRGEIEKFEHPEVRVDIVHEGVGGVNESDVSLASASGAIIIAFHVIPEDRAELLAEREGVDIRRYQVIYEVTDTIKRALEGMLVPEKVEVATGRALVLQTFSISRLGTIAGCRVLGGTIERSNRVRVIRDQTILNDYAIASLRREKDDVKEVREGMECGIRLEGFNDVKEGDLLEAYRVDEVKRTLD